MFSGHTPHPTLSPMIHIPTIYYQNISKNMEVTAAYKHNLKNEG